MQKRNSATSDNLQKLLCSEQPPSRHQPFFKTSLQKKWKTSRKDFTNPRHINSPIMSYDAIWCLTCGLSNVSPTSPISPSRRFTQGAQATHGLWDPPGEEGTYQQRHETHREENHCRGNARLGWPLDFPGFWSLHWKNCLSLSITIFHYKYNISIIIYLSLSVCLSACPSI